MAVKRSELRVDDRFRWVGGGSRPRQDRLQRPPAARRARAAHRRHVHRFGSRSDFRRPRERSVAGPAAVIALAGFFLVSLTTPWVPPEEISVQPSAASEFRPVDGFARAGRDLQGTAYVM